ncbi:MAG: hypothetical protein K2F81_06535 [Ruminococcus sp.]|nr:hypothetical protein [Ruminococcus sp.]
MDNIRFKKICHEIVNSDRRKNGIGTLGEKTLHAVLKSYFEPHEDNQEIKLGKYIADIVNENGVVEIQTQNFNALRNKLENFLEFCNVTVVFPIAQTKYLSWIDMKTGEKSKRRKSPKTGTIYDCFRELYKIKYTLDNPRMNICLVMLEMEELRYLNGWSKDKKKGSTRCDRIPIDILHEIYLSNPQDYSIFLSENLPNSFTSKDFAEQARIKLKTAQTALNILCYLEVISKIGKDGNNIIYSKNNF